MSKITCQVCCEDVNEKKQITCVKCNYASCIGCVKKFITSVNEEPHCMNCKLPWSLEFLYEKLPKTFVNTTYKKHKTNCLLSAEKSFLHSTLPLIERQNKIDAKKKEIDEIKNKKKELQKQMCDMYRQLREKNRELNQVIHGTYGNVEHHAGIRKCCKETCNGFLDVNFTCSACHCNVCPECNEVKQEGQEHVCNPDTVESVRVLLANSKPCPSCGTMISKAHGCDQMWCPECHTTFSWNTGQVSRGNTHNPHYFEWLRREGRNERNVMDIPCGGVPARTHMLDMLGQRLNRDQSNIWLEQPFISAHETVEDMERYEMRKYNIDEERLNTELTNLRIQYLRNQITEEVWKRKLQTMNHKNAKNKEVLQIMQTYVIIVSDLYRRLINTPRNEIVSLEDEFELLKSMRDFYNSRLSQVSSLYKSVVPMISTENGRIISFKV